MPLSIEALLFWVVATSVGFVTVLLGIAILFGRRYR